MSRLVTWILGPAVLARRSWAKVLPILLVLPLLLPTMSRAQAQLETPAQKGCGDRRALYEQALGQWQAGQPGPPRRARHPRAFPWVGRHPMVRYNPVSLLLSSALWGYQQVLSPQIQAECAYHVSCSAYARGAIAHYGPLKGVALSADRLTRCNRLSAADVPEIARDATWRLHDGPANEAPFASRAPIPVPPAAP